VKKVVNEILFPACASKATSRLDQENGLGDSLAPAGLNARKLKAGQNQ
jgi:hypothetical protein